MQVLEFQSENEGECCISDVTCALDCLIAWFCYSMDSLWIPD